MALAAEGHHVVAIRGGQARITDHLPYCLAAIAAVDRIGKRALREEGIEKPVEPAAELERRRIGFAACDGLERFLALLFVEAVERLPVSGDAPAVQRRDADLVPSLRGHRELVAMLRLPLAERRLEIEPIAAAEPAGELAINESRNAELGPRRRESVRRPHVVDERFGSSCFLEAQR